MNASIELSEVEEIESKSLEKVKTVSSWTTPKYNPIIVRVRNNKNTFTDEYLEVLKGLVHSGSLIINRANKESTPGVNISNK